MNKPPQTIDSVLGEIKLSLENDEGNDETEYEEPQDQEEISNSMKPEDILIEELPHFNEVKNGLGLEGKEYDQGRILVWYNLVSHAIRAQHISFGTDKLDPRIPALLPWPSDHGKIRVKNFIRSVVSARGEKFVLCTSIHPEALIGKIVKRKGSKDNPNPAPVVKYGAFKSDYIFIDEALELFRSQLPLDKQSTSYLRQAFDTYGQNNVEKTMVDFGIEDPLNYCPCCSGTLCMQPLSIKAETVLTGNLRRFLIASVDTDIRARLGHIAGSLNQEDSDSDEMAVTFARWTNELNKLASPENHMTIGHTWELTPIAKKQVLSEVFKILRDTWAEPEAREFTIITAFTLRNYLIKMACCIAAVREVRFLSSFETVRYIMGTDVERAAEDLAEIWQSVIHYVLDHVDGRLSYTDPFRNLSDNERMWLEWLVTMSEGKKWEECPTLREFVRAVIKMSKVSPKYASKVSTKLKKKGVAESKKVLRKNEEGKEESIWTIRATPESSEDEKFPDDLAQELGSSLTTNPSNPSNP